jgi:arginase
LANAHLARLVSDAAQAQAFPLLLESNCYATLGALAGLQKSAGPRSPRVGMIWIDAHGDCNTPETTLSGMLSGMLVAIATGLCLQRLRKQAGLDPPDCPARCRDGWRAGE